MTARLMTGPRVAELAGISYRQLDYWVTEGLIPMPDLEGGGDDRGAGIRPPRHVPDRSVWRGGVMNPYLWFLAFTATVCTLPTAMAAGAAIRDAFYRREAARLREQQGRQVDAEWLAILAATESTPIYDALVCEGIEKAEGWS